MIKLSKISPFVAFPSSTGNKSISSRRTLFHDITSSTIFLLNTQDATTSTTLLHNQQDVTPSKTFLLNTQDVTPSTAFLLNTQDVTPSTTFLLNKQDVTPSTTFLHNQQDVTPSTTFLCNTQVATTTSTSTFKTTTSNSATDPFLSAFKSPTVTINIISFNCRSIRNKTQSVLSYFDENKIDLICLQETWLNEGDGNVLVEIKEYDYDIINKTRNNKKGGGLLILSKPHLRISKVVLKCDKSFETFEHILGRVVVDDHIFIILNLYRPPYSVANKCTIKMFLQEFENLIDAISDINGSLLMFGDFNININDCENIYVCQFQQLLEMNSLVQVVTEPTHIKGSLLDLIIIGTNQTSEKLHVQRETQLYSDHFPVKLVLELEARKSVNEIEFKSFKDINRMNWVQFGEDLKQSVLTDVKYFSSLTLDKVISLFEKSLTHLYEKHCPTITKRYKPKQSKSPWFNSNLQHLKQKRRQCERLYRKVLDSESLKAWKSARREYSKELKNTRTNFYSKQIDNCTEDPKQFHKILGKLTGYKKERSLPYHDDPIILAESLSSYFSDKVSNIRNSIRPDVLNDNYNKTISNKNTSLQQFDQINSQELTLILTQMNSKTCDLDPIPTMIIKKFIPLLLPIISRIVNLSIASCTFPNALKHAVITPVSKSTSKSKDDFSNYRPVSNLPFLSKVIEKAISNQLTTHIEGNKMYAKHQSAYRRNHSCETSIFQAVNFIQQSTLERKYVVLVSLDSSSAFDTVDHDLLLQRLEHQCMIKGQALKLLKSYLSNRTYSIKIGSVKSKPRISSYGVPQGSLLGPQFYNLYTSELEDVITECDVNVEMYADDILLLLAFNEEDKKDAESRGNACLQKVKEWMERSFLKLNMDKTVFKLFAPKNGVNDLPYTLRYGTTVLIPSKSVTFLGAKLSESQKLSSFVSEKVRKCNFILRNISHLSDYLPFKSKVTLVTNLILSSLDYCNSALACATDADVRPLRLILNRSVRFIFKIRRTEHITSYLFKLHFLPIEYRIKFKIALMGFKIINNLSPAYLNEEFQMFEPTTTLHLRTGIGRDRTMFDETLIQRRQNTIKTKLIVEWNKLPYEIRTVTTLSSFKNKLKTFYFRKAFAECLDN